MNMRESVARFGDVRNRDREVADFAKGGMPEIGIPLQESRGEEARRRTALEFRWRASQM